MDERDMFPTASDWISGTAGDEGITTTRLLAGQFGRDRPGDDAGEVREVTAEWALWGKDGTESGYRVLRCSKGVFGPADFHGIISRYASGAKDKLPQYTVCWIPAGKREERYGAAGRGPADDDGGQGYLAVGIHELVGRDPRRFGGRARTADGREIEYVRLFCVRYAELAEFGTSYTGLLEAVQEHQLPAGSTGPLQVKLPQTAPPATAPSSSGAALYALAENIVMLLLTIRPVCVLGAEAATAEDRRDFIELVMSLLPYGLRTTMSASTWASSTAQDLKLRLFFSNARLNDGGRTSYVTWGQPAGVALRTAGDDAPSLYLAWLRHVGSHAAALLAGLTDPVRFDPAEIRKMVASLPEDKPIEQSLDELANNLRHGDQLAVSAVVQRLQRYHEPSSAERHAHRQQIGRLGLLKDRPGIHPGTSQSVYRVLLRLAFSGPLTYANYCEIEDAIGGPPRGTLRSVLLAGEFATLLPWLLAAKAEAEFADADIMKGLADRGMQPTELLSGFQRQLMHVRSEHRPATFDFTLQYLLTHVENPRAELIRRGYLADTLQTVFAGDRKAQQIRLEKMLWYIYRGQLKRDQISELFSAPGLYPTPALEAAVAGLAASRKARRFIEEQAATARLLHEGHPDNVRTVQRGAQRPSRRLNGTDTIWGFPKKNLVIIGAIGLVLVVVVVVIMVLAPRPL
jgi:hypothetical protein